MPSWSLTISYHFIKALIRVAIFLLSRTRIYGLEQVPRSGAALIVSNHLAAVDPALLVGVLPRPIVLMSKIENYRGVVGFFMRLVGAFPVRRGKVDREALRIAERTLAEGRLLCVFPEGTRGSGALGRGYGGAALLAARACVPVVPIAITGTPRVFARRFPWLGFPCVTVRVGEPFLPQSLEQAPSREQRERLTDEIMARIAVLLPQEMRGRYEHAQS